MVAVKAPACLDNGIFDSSARACATHKKTKRTTKFEKLSVMLVKSAVRERARTLLSAIMTVLLSFMDSTRPLPIMIGL